MKHHDCHTNQQGRLPCTCDRSPLGSPWDWIDDLRDRRALVASAVAIVAIGAMAYSFFH